MKGVISTLFLVFYLAGQFISNSVASEGDKAHFEIRSIEMPTTSDSYNVEISDLSDSYEFEAESSLEFISPITDTNTQEIVEFITGSEYSEEDSTSESQNAVIEAITLEKYDTDFASTEQFENVYDEHIEYFYAEDIAIEAEDLVTVDEITNNSFADTDFYSFQYEDTATTESDYYNKVYDEIQNRGNFGRLSIADIGTDVAVIYTDNLYSLQSIVDAEDSACMFLWTDGSTIIADHVNQGFSNLKYSVPMNTEASLYTANGVTNYLCNEIIYNGWNNGSCLAYNDGTPVTASCADIIFYTCNSDGTITITLWSEI